MKTERQNPLYFAIVVIFVVVVAVIWISSGKEERDQNDTISIGAVLPLTGDAATFGKNTAQGAQLAIDLAVEQGLVDAGTVELILEDSRGEASQAASAARKLVDVDSVDYVIGDVTSAGTHAIVPIVNRQQIPLGSPSASDPALSGSSPYFFRVWPSDDFEALVISEYARTKGYKSIAVLYANTDYGIAMSDEFRGAAAGIKISESIGVDRETMNFRPVIQRIKAANVDAAFVVLYPEDWARLLRQMRESGLSLPLLATATFEDPSLLSEANAAGVVFASPVPPSEESPERLAFEQRYTEKFGDAPGTLSDTGYDLAMILINAHLAAEGEGADAVMEQIYSLKGYSGISGEMTFNANGDVEKPYALKVVQDGAFTWFKQ